LSSVNDFYAQLRIPCIAIFQQNYSIYSIKNNIFWCLEVSSSNCMSKCKFYIFAESLWILPSPENLFKRRIKLYNCMIKLLHIFLFGKISLEFEEDTYFTSTRIVAIFLSIGLKIYKLSILTTFKFNRGDYNYKICNKRNCDNNCIINRKYGNSNFCIWYWFWWNRYK